MRPGPAASVLRGHEDTLKNMAQLAVRDLADFCSVDVVDQDGTTAEGRESRPFEVMGLRSVDTGRA
jgi:hypothetical protein